MLYKCKSINSETGRLQTKLIRAVKDVQKVYILFILIHKKKGEASPTKMSFEYKVYMKIDCLNE